MPDRLPFSTLLLWGSPEILESTDDSSCKRFHRTPVLSTFLFYPALIGINPCQILFPVTSRSSLVLPAPPVTQTCPEAQIPITSSTARLCARFDESQHQLDLGAPPELARSPISFDLTSSPPRLPLSTPFIVQSAPEDGPFGSSTYITPPGRRAPRELPPQRHYTISF